MVTWDTVVHREIVPRDSVDSIASAGEKSMEKSSHAYLPHCRVCDRGGDARYLSYPSFERWRIEFRRI